MIANCVVCGKEFLKTNSSQKTCSVECSKQNRRNKKKAAYWAAHDKYLQRKRTYNKEHREELRLAAQVRRAKKPKNTYKCVVCGASFLKNMRNGNAITCSAECSKTNERQKNKERYRAYYESNKERYIAYWKKKYAENPRIFKEKALRYHYEVKAARRFLYNNFIGTKGLSRAQIRRLGQRVLENQQFLWAVSN